MTTTDTGPQTEAGQHYLDQPPGSLDEWERAILAIEAESAGVAGSLRGALAYLLAALDMDSHDPGKRRTVKEAREHAAEAFGATPPPVPTREHVTDADDPLACWCVPYRDSEYPEVIIHRKDDEA